MNFLKKLLFSSHSNNEHDLAQAIISSMGEALLVVNPDKKIAVINPVAERLLEISNDQAIGKSWFDIVTTFKGNRQTPIEERSFSQSLIKGATIITKLENDHYYQTRTGKIFPIVSITAPIVRNGQIIGAIKLFHDASQEKQASQIIENKVIERTKELRAKNIALEKAKTQINENWLQLQNEKARLTASLVNLPMGFILIDTQNNITFSNEIVKNILFPNNLTDFINLFLSDINYCQQKHLPSEIKEHLLSGKYLHLYFTPVCPQTPHKNCIGVAILVEDITEAKILERSKDEFFSIASHELRTPLTAIRGNSSLLCDYYADKITDPNAKDMINDIHDASVRLISIVNDFLDLSRLETGKISFKITNFPISNLVSETIKQFQESCSNPQINLINSITDHSLTVSADSERTRQVLTNLIGNAYKFTEKGEIKITAIVLDSQVQIDISDTGRGIALTQQPLLFRKFQQAGENLFTRDTTKGTGLGLYISKLVVEGMGGKIWLSSSTPNVGSVFSFTLPKNTPLP